MGNGGIDFLVNGRFLEWHPIMVYFSESGGYGEIKKKEEYTALKQCLNNITDKKLCKEFKEKYREILKVKYRTSREEKIKNSGYEGTPLHLATNVKELYEFFKKVADPNKLPSFKDFKKEFMQTQARIKAS